MFVYWDGFEIDGSDTDFDVVLPENVQMLEFVDCFLSLPIFGHGSEPDISWVNGSKADAKTFSLTVDELRKKLLAGDYPDIAVNINCLPMEELPADVQERLYGISSRREPLEEAYGKVENPCMPPVRQHGYTRGNMTVELRIPKPGSVGCAAADRDDIEGYVNNIELLCSNENGGVFQVNVGPTFYFEYAMYIIDSLRDSFPGLATCGGLDCQGGWTNGCTYADSIYAFEKIQLGAIRNGG